MTTSPRRSRSRVLIAAKSSARRPLSAPGYLFTVRDDGLAVLDKGRKRAAVDTLAQRRLTRSLIGRRQKQSDVV
jgi:hypothetical protein